MHDWISFNNQTINNAEARISAVSAAGLYGKGVFTTITVRDGLPFLFDKHWLRLERDAAQLKISLAGINKATLFSLILDLVDRNEVTEGRCRVTLFDESSPPIWDQGVKKGTSALIQTADRLAMKDTLSLCVSKWPVNSASPLNAIKSCNYLEKTGALEAVAESGFDEAVRVNELGEIVSACMANIFWIKNERVFTPDSGTGLLEGTVREYVLERCSVSRVRAGIDELQQAQSVFLTSSGKGLASVSEIVFGSESVSYEVLGDDFYETNGLEKLKF